MIVPRCRGWLEKNGRPRSEAQAHTAGRARLLAAIGRASSIQGGAEALGMSYRNAWAHLDHIERRLGIRFLTVWP